MSTLRTVTATAGTASVNGTPRWLTVGSEPIYGVLHAPAAKRRDTAAVLLPPFGWEEVCSYRARREWAIALAQAGIPTLRFDLPGSEESVGSPIAPGRWRTWIEAAVGTAGWLREATGRRRLVAIGIGLGGILATVAVADGAPIDDLVLWGVPAKGRTHLRELRAYAGVIVSEMGEPDDDGPPDPDGVIGVAGYRLSGETVAELERVNLAELELPDAARRRVLLIERDSRGVDKRLREALEASGASVTVQPAGDYADLMAHPQHAKVPAQSIARSVQWLVQGSEPPAGPAGDPAPALQAVTFEYDGARVRETMVERHGEFGRMFGILCAPAAGPRAGLCLVLLNTGAIRRTGPNRMWTELARRWAARGVPSLRLDVDALGDSDGAHAKYIDNEAMYEPRLTELELALLDSLQEQGVADSFAPIGLCSSSYWGLHAAVADPRVIGAVLINLFAFRWTRRLVAERDRRRTAEVIREGLLERYRRKGFPRAELARGVRATLTAVGGRVGGSEEARHLPLIDDSLDRLRERNTRLLLLFSRREPLYAQLRRSGRLEALDRWPNLSVEQLPTRDHELRPLWIQERVAARIDREIEELLTRVTSVRGDRAADPS